MTKALVVLSGGQDSSTCTFWARMQFDEVHAITFDYGQTHSIEIEAACRIATLSGMRSHEVVRVGPVLKSTSPLIDPQQPLERYDSYEQMDKVIGDRVEKTFVPMRNAMFLTIAANHAVALGANDLVTGVCQADNANYPDCRLDFINAQQHTINEALGYHQTNTFRIVTPLMEMSKAESIRFAMKFGGYYALAFTHTAYDGRYPPTSMDHASVLRAHGFEEAGLPDPLVIRAVEDGYMALPTASNYQDVAANGIVAQQINLLRNFLEAQRLLQGAAR